jgi:hypothetical protein
VPTQRLSTRRIKQLLTMHFGVGASARSIARMKLDVPGFTPRQRLRPNPSRQERARLMALLVAVAIAFGVFIMLAWSFGRS